ncbi:DMT family transporter [Lysobacter sp. BMK333-48F3]|uniref:DMT family transporter n=1 Tax=Lysobacter sp. BMK333-48F3 TaxID=2867962 RepID=UPI001C8BD514|nr:DMT family transporter [Lysobacter sp. BMK333-48F3]MBX9401954.1 DMT family transporter [Lysobacter sp. BMK333-48F3]
MSAPAVSSTDSLRTPLLQMLFGASVISSSAVFVRWVQIGPAASAFWRMALAALILLLVVARPWQRGRLRDWRPDARTLGLVMLGAAFMALDLWLWHRSILYVGVGLSTLLANFQVFVLAGVGAIWLGEHTSWRLWTGLVMGLLGLALLLAPGWGGMDARFRLGVVYGLGAALAYGGFLLAFRAAQARRGRTPNEALQWWLCLGCAIMLLAPVPFGGENLWPTSAHDWLILFAYAAIAQVLGWLVIGRAMPLLPAGIVGLCLLLQPLLAYVWDVLLFGKRLGAIELIGLALSLAGIFLGLARGDQPLFSPRRDPA